MQPEPGDPNVRVTRADIATAARETGLQEGDTLLFHSSLSSMGTVVGGPDAVIDGFLDALGPTGTLAVPTLCNWPPGEQELVFDRWDPATSPSYVGMITEHFRQRPDAVRSDNPTHSVAAIGAGAAELTADHGVSGQRLCPFGNGAFARSSPWQKLVDRNGWYGFIGVDFRIGTLVHFVECGLVEETLARAEAWRRERLANEVAQWLRDGVWPWIPVDTRPKLEPILAAQGRIRYGRIGSATFRMVRAWDFVSGMRDAALAEPEVWLGEGYRAWVGRCASVGS